MTSPRGKSLLKSSYEILTSQIWAKILLGLVLGILIGLFLSPDVSGRLPMKQAFSIAEWLALPGVIFLGLIQMVIVPLIVSSIILGIAEAASLSFLKKMGLRVVVYFILTTAVSISIGIGLVSVIKPGLYIDQDMVQIAMDSGLASERIPQQTFEDLTVPQRISNMMPTNPARASLERNMLQLVIASILVGIAMLSIPAAQTRALHDFLVSVQMITMKIISWAMHLAPYAVFGLISSITIKLGVDAFVGVGAYMGAVLAGLACILVVYALILALVAKRSPWAFWKSIREVQLLAFSTSSSAATMPFSIQAAEENLKIQPNISRFVIPLGATINMDGTAIYQAIAALFLCQVFGVELSGAQTVLLLITTVGASIGTPGTPGVGIVVLATILSGIGVPPEGIALILGVDRILDMCRTTINVTGDLTACAVMDRFNCQKA